MTRNILMVFSVFSLRKGVAVMKKALACTMFLGVVFSQPAAADELKFKRGIGVIPVSSGVAISPTLATA